MQQLDTLISQNTPCFFMTDFLGKHIKAYALECLEYEGIRFDFSNTIDEKHDILLSYSPIDFKAYSDKINTIKSHIKLGNTYVMNFTQPTLIKSNHTLDDIYHKARAPFKLKYRDEFVCFSPEPFISIKGNTISAFPMKGTIDATIVNAHQKLMEDKKEQAEHVMIVDLLRNDLSMVAHDVHVPKFRYAQTIYAGATKLIQTSSHIQGTLPTNWRKHFTQILHTLLPAGSISGTPKKSTTRIIQEVEGYDRGFYTGVMGYFDGKNITTAVMIRFIQRVDDTLVYKSGGGITIDSDAQKEYDEMLAKIYVP